MKSQIPVAKGFEQVCMLFFLFACTHGGGGGFRDLPNTRSFRYVDSHASDSFYHPLTIRWGTLLPFQRYRCRKRVIRRLNDLPRCVASETARTMLQTLSICAGGVPHAEFQA